MMLLIEWGSSQKPDGRDMVIWSMQLTKVKRNYSTIEWEALTDKLYYCHIVSCDL